MKTPEKQSTAGAAPAPAKPPVGQDPATTREVDGTWALADQEEKLQFIEAHEHIVGSYEKDDADKKTNKATVSDRDGQAPPVLKLVALDPDADAAAITKATSDMVLAFNGVAYVLSNEQMVLGLRKKS